MPRLLHLELDDTKFHLQSQKYRANTSLFLLEALHAQPLLLTALKVYRPTVENDPDLSTHLSRILTSFLQSAQSLTELELKGEIIFIEQDITPAHLPTPSLTKVTGDRQILRLCRNRPIASVAYFPSSPITPTGWWSGNHLYREVGAELSEALHATDTGGSHLLYFTASLRYEGEPYLAAILESFPNLTRLELILIPTVALICEHDPHLPHSQRTLK